MKMQDSDFLRACRGQAVSKTPVWFMRQAGRSLPEYRALRTTETILDAIRHPELAAEITMQPVRRHGVDAAILFSDIVVPIAAIGVGVEIVAGKGPVIEVPFRSAADLDRLRTLEPEVDTPYVLETIKILIAELDVPLIGFAGAPFTVGSYFIEGGPTRTFTKAKSLMHNDPQLFLALMDRLADLAIASLRSQIEAGASAVQLFDSWAGALSRADYQRFVLPSTTKVFAALADTGVPRIHFGVDTGELLDLMAAPEIEVLGVDWRTPLTSAQQRTGSAVALQGNLDPAICLAGFDAVIPETRRILAEGAVAPGHIFNLGHGVLPETDPDVLTRLVELVHAEGRHS
jgi:uroporphyrinogen decarboxylase